MVQQELKVFLLKQTSKLNVTERQKAVDNWSGLQAAELADLHLNLDEAIYQP